MTIDANHKRATMRRRGLMACLCIALAGAAPDVRGVERDRHDAAQARQGSARSAEATGHNMPKEAGIAVQAPADAGQNQTPASPAPAAATPGPNLVQPISIRPLSDPNAAPGDVVTFEVSIPPQGTANSAVMIDCEKSAQGAVDLTHFDGDTDKDLPCLLTFGHDETTARITLKVKTTASDETLHVYAGRSAAPDPDRRTTALSVLKSVDTNNRSNGQPLPCSITTASATIQSGIQTFDLTVGVNAINGGGAPLRMPRGNRIHAANPDDWVWLDCSDRNALAPSGDGVVATQGAVNGWPIKVFFSDDRSVALHLSSTQAANGSAVVMAYRRLRDPRATPRPDADADCALTLKSLKPAP